MRQLLHRVDSSKTMAHAVQFQTELAVLCKQTELWLTQETSATVTNYKRESQTERTEHILPHSLHRHQKSLVDHVLLLSETQFKDLMEH